MAPRPIPSTSDAPQLSALYLATFDHKTGYTLSWKRSVAGLDLEGAVEYKSLPSGLHSVSEDVVYLVHDQHAGVATFVNAPCEDEDRHARMVAVGVLVPLGAGRAGRCWKHVAELQILARNLADKSADISVLEKYWEENQIGGDNETLDSNSSNSPSDLSLKIPKKRNFQDHSQQHRDRSVSDGTLPTSGKALDVHHPARRLPNMLSTFGPLIFPIYRAALLRKRILISCHTPVHQICDFVYNLSLLSNIPLATIHDISNANSCERIRPLFSVGVHDIPMLEKAYEQSRRSIDSHTIEGDPTGWIACTTDGIIATKPKLYDVLITMPTQESSQGCNSSPWPRVESSGHIPQKATQRDLRRYHALRRALSDTHQTPHPSTHHMSPPFDAEDEDDDDDHRKPFLPTNTDTDPDTESITEPLSWSALAYKSYMWWASSGSGALPDSIDFDGEYSQDIALLADFLPLQRRPSSSSNRGGLAGNRGSSHMGTVGPVKRDEYGDDNETFIELAIIAYFHRWTSTIIGVLAETVDAADDTEEAISSISCSQQDGHENENAECPPDVVVDAEDLKRMGLDHWSNSDVTFVKDLCERYFCRHARYSSAGLDICGVRIC